MGSQGPGGYGNLGNPDPVLAKRQLRLLNEERQKQVVSDAAKLLVLARELNAEVAANRSSSLTSEQLRQLSEIEKLAKKVREKMALAVGAEGPVLPAQEVP